MLAGHWQDYKYELVHAVKTRGLAVGWAALSKKSLQPAGFNAPELLFPIMRQDANSKLVTIDHGADTLLALPLVEKRTHFKSLASPLLASGMPHISRDMTETVLLAFLNCSMPFQAKVPFCKCCKTKQHNLRPSNHGSVPL
jgi:hypothetical protein